jgi:hypothetical protein
MPNVNNHPADIVTATVKAPQWSRRWAYYSGNHPAIWATPKLREVFRNLADAMTTNYCGPAVESRVSRLRIVGWTGTDATAAADVWTRSRMPQRHDRLVRWALAHGRAVILVDGTAGTIHAQPASLATVVPNPEWPDEPLFAGKVWDGHDDAGRVVRHATIYYADRTERFVHTPSGWALRESTPQPLAAVPAVLVEPYADGPPLMDAIASPQDRINKLSSNKMVAAEFGAFRQRVFFTRQEIDPFDVRQAPDHAIVLDPGEPDAAARVQEMSATDLANYDNAINAEVDALFTLAAMPRHLRVNPGTPPSGDAIKADESAFLEAVRANQREIGEGFAAAMALLGYDASPQWSDPEPDQDETNARTISTLVAAGIPWQSAAERQGWTADEIARAEARTAGGAAGNAVGQALLDAFNAPTTPPPDAA